MRVTTPLFRIARRPGWQFQNLLEGQGGVNDDGVSRGRVQHGVIERSVWPLHVEVTLNKGCPVAVDGVHPPGYALLCVEPRETGDVTNAQTLRRDLRRRAAGKRLWADDWRLVREMPLIDKNDILDRSFEWRGVGNTVWRRTLSLESDAILQHEATDSKGAVLVSLWRLPECRQTPGLRRTGSILLHTRWLTSTLRRRPASLRTGRCVDALPPKGAATQGTSPENPPPANCQRLWENSLNSRRSPSTSESTSRHRENESQRCRPRDPVDLISLASGCHMIVHEATSNSETVIETGIEWQDRRDWGYFEIGRRDDSRSASLAVHERNRYYSALETRSTWLSRFDPSDANELSRALGPNQPVNTEPYWSGNQQPQENYHV